jgi:hypothetical protein
VAGSWRLERGCQFCLQRRAYRGWIVLTAISLYCFRTKASRRQGAGVTSWPDCCKRRFYVKLIPLVALSSCMVALSLSAQTITYISDGRSLTASASQVGGIGPASDGPVTRLPTAPFGSSFSEAAVAQLPFATAAAAQGNLSAPLPQFGPDGFSSLSFLRATAGVHPAGPVQSASSASSIFTIIFSVDSAVAFDLTGNGSVALPPWEGSLATGQVKLSAGPIILAEWDLQQGMFGFSGLLLPDTLYTFSANITGSALATYAPNSPAVQFSDISLVADLNVRRAVPDTGNTGMSLALVLIAMGLTARSRRARFSARLS